MNEKEKSLAHDELLLKLTYNPLTGIFTWNQNSSNVYAGAVAGTPKSDYYTITINSKKYKAHRLAWFYMYKEWPDRIDHKNTIGTDNRIENLRIATNQQNQRNRKKFSNNTSGYTGVYWHENAWVATITIEKGKRKNLGRYDDAKVASDVREAYAKEYFGEFYKPLDIVE